MNDCLALRVDNIFVEHLANSLAIGCDLRFDLADPENEFNSSRLIQRLLSPASYWNHPCPAVMESTLSAVTDQSLEK